MFAPVDAERLGLFHAAATDVEPLVGKGAAHAAEHLFGDKIPNRPFHHAPGRRSAQVHKPLRIEKLLELRLDLPVKILKTLTSMADHR